MKEKNLCDGCKFLTTKNPKGEYMCTKPKRAWDLGIKGKNCLVKLKDNTKDN